MHKTAAFNSCHTFEPLSTQPSPFCWELKAGRVRFWSDGNGMDAIVTVFFFLGTTPLWEARQENVSLLTPV